MNPLTYEPADPARDMPALSRILSHAFAFPPEDAPPWLERAGLRHVRVVREGGDGGGDPLGCLLLIPMGQFFGGRIVAMTGIAGVGVAPEARGRGVATTLMREAVREIHASGAPLSALYPATQPLYRRAGYEQAGHRFEVRVPLMRLQASGRAERELDIQPFAPGMIDELKTCYRGVAVELDGHLDRCDYIWGRIQNPRAGPASGFVLRGPGGIEGYIFFRQERAMPTSARHDIAISDWCAATERAGRRLLEFLGEFASMAEEMVCYGGPGLPILMLMREQRHIVRLRDHWMLRITDAAAAFAARGFSPGLKAEVHLEIADDLIPANAGKRVLRVSDRAASLEAGGTGSIRIDARGLASWYSGYSTLAVLRRLGLAAGEDAAIRAADGVIAGSAPWMPDMF